MDRKTWIKQLWRELAVALAGVTLIGAPLFVRAVSQEMEPAVVLAKSADRRLAPPAGPISEQPVRCRDCHRQDQPAAGGGAGIPADPGRQSLPVSGNRGDNPKQ